MQNIYLSVLIFVLMVSACTNPFTTRDVEIPPVNQGGATFDLPTSVDVVFSNLKFAITEKNHSRLCRPHLLNLLK